jgi:hypothetical protein|tara:strand:+ start:247 stop:732 length:486 start_codon:yes stop_codon:yes gene_type:complete
MSIKVIDKFFKGKENNKILKEIKTLKFKKGESDRPETPPTGKVTKLKKTSFIYKTFLKNFKKQKIVPSGKKIFRAYINSFEPNENPYYHSDGKDVTTLLYYAVDFDEHDVDLGGETLFINDPLIQGIVPKKHRLVIFAEDVWHKATPFRDKIRYTIVFKYK